MGSGPLLAAVEPSLALGAVFAILMTGLVLLDVLTKSEQRVWMLEPGPVSRCWRTPPECT
jgi:hypothetical protein